MSMKITSKELLEVFNLSEDSADCENCPHSLIKDCKFSKGEKFKGNCLAWQKLKEVITNGCKDSE